MQNNTLLVAAVAVVIGFGIGYTVHTYSAPSMEHSYMSTDSGHMGDTMANMNAGLQGKSGDEFDKAFLAEMTVHHQGAVQMAQAALVNAKHQEIKDLAAGIIAAQNKEILQMQGWQKAWYK